MSKETITLNISGMTCVNCSNAVEKVTLKMRGVEDVKVSFASAKGEFTIDTELTDKDAVVTKVKKLGYGVANNVAELEAKKEEELQDLKRTFFIALILTLVVSFLEKVPVLGDSGIWVMFAAATIVQVYAGGRFYSHAFKALANKNYDMNVLVALGTTAAYGYSAFVVLFPSLFPEHLRYIYFMGSTIIITFILLGKFLEERSKAKATNFLKNLMDLSPDTALKLTEDGLEQTVRVENLGLGDIVIIKSGEKISADGVVIEGEAEIDTSMITGEPLPVLKKSGDDVVAGTINKTGYLKVRVEKLASDSMLSSIVNLLGDAQNQKMPIGRFADRIANIFVPSVISIAVLTFIIWYALIGDTLSAILASISVLIISCPCALGLATPIAIVSAVGKGAKHGILIKNPEVLEIIKDVKYAIFDKTGTLTQGKITATQSLFLDDEALRLIASAESRSEHPISEAITLHVKEKNIALSDDVSDVEVLPGRGIKAMVEGKKIIVGSVAFLEEEGKSISNEILTWMDTTQKNGNGAVVASVEDVTGCFLLVDELKEEAKEVLESLKKEGITTVMLTGDHENTAKSIAEKVGIDLVYADVLPHEKFKVIQKFQEEAKVLFVGDGINDAPSLKQADIGMALSSGSDIAKDAGDIVLINNELRSVQKSIKLSIASMRTIKQNLFWAFIYNIIGIPLAAGALYPLLGVMLTPMYAGIAMSFSSVTVVLNSLRLKMKKL